MGVPLSAWPPPSTVPRAAYADAACRTLLECYSGSMGDQRALDAISRLEQALARIESAAARPKAPPPPDNSEDHERLREAHAALRRSVAGAIGQIDHLIETGGRG